MFPGDAMNGCEEEGTSRGADQVVFPLHDSIAGNANETDRASAIGTVFGRLEIDRDESQSIARGRESADWKTITPILYFRTSRG